jgi:hypothetical protein
VARQKKNDPIDQADRIAYLEKVSDFAFELRCLERLTKLGFQCQHGGSYTDPVTNKTRQFDLRVQKSKGKFRITRFSSFFRLTSLACSA